MVESALVEVDVDAEAGARSCAREALNFGGSRIFRSGTIVVRWSFGKQTKSVTVKLEAT